jgi:hypothetical protein
MMVVVGRTSLDAHHNPDVDGHVCVDLFRRRIIKKKTG